jgi:hypothetical protein
MKLRKAIVPSLRQQLGLSSVGVEVDSVRVTLSGKELVHTAYFHNSDVLDLVSGAYLLGGSRRSEKTGDKAYRMD